MRDDLAKKMVETYRRGGYGDGSHQKRARDKATDPENLPKKESIRKHYRDQKSFDENFAALLGILKKNTGRNWDKVRSEITSNLHGGGTVIEHSKTHLFRDFVIQKPMWINGRACNLPIVGSPRPIRPGSFYVDKQGRLQEGKGLRKPGTDSNVKVQMEISPLEDYRKLQGVWYHVWYRALSEEQSLDEHRSYGLLDDDVVAQIGGRRYTTLRRLHGSVPTGTFKGRTRTAIRAVRVPKKEIRNEGLNQQEKKNG